MNLKGYASVKSPVPVSVQNLVLRDYCARNGHTLSLSDVEFLSGHHMLEGLLENLDAFDGICAYSMWLMPETTKNVATKEIHFALENYVFPRDKEMLLTLWRLKSLIG